MARPRKNNAERFSHDVELRNNRKIKAIRQKFGAEWYAVFVMFLEVLTDAEDFKIKFEEDEIELLAWDFNVEIARLESIVQYMIKLELLQCEDWFIYNNHLIERLDPLLKKREAMRQKYKEEKQPSEKQQPPPKPPKKEVPRMTLEQFEKFWEAYPAKKDKKKAQEKFLKLDPAKFDIIIQAIEEQKKGRQRIEWFIPYPTTRMNGDRRNDQVDYLPTTPTAKNGQSIHKKSESTAWKVSENGSFDVVV